MRTDEPADPTLIPVRFRRRLTVAFILVAGISTAALATLTFVFVREYRMTDFSNRAAAQADLALAIARPRGEVAGLNRLVELARNSDDFTVIGTNGTWVITSDPSVTLEQIPERYRDDTPDRRDDIPSININGSPYLVVPRTFEPGAYRVVTLFPQNELFGGLDEIRNILFGGWVAVILLSALAGSIIARRTLAPVSVVATTARLMAEDLAYPRSSRPGKDEFDDWARAFNDMALTLREKINALTVANEREKRFTADVAHDLRTPLTAMVTAASLLEEQTATLPDAARRPAELIIDDVRKLQRLTVDLLELNRLDAGQEPLNCEPVRVDLAIQAIVDGSSRPNGIGLDLRPVTTSCDLRRLDRIVSNLLDNAVQHGDGQVLVTCRELSGEAVITVEDRGPGIPSDQLTRVFDRFYKLSDSRSEGGSGLGLAIALRNSELLGGSLQAENRDGGGARFRLALPVT